jgi:hypothetical protein|tara:strand:+ start:666 stop:797 length:132 start_codon:yes stop_codon:yes gene_type:complete
MEEKLTKKQLQAIKEHRKNNPKEPNHVRRARIKKKLPWWISSD